MFQSRCKYAVFRAHQKERFAMANPSALSDKKYFTHLNRWERQSSSNLKVEYSCKLESLVDVHGLPGGLLEVKQLAPLQARIAQPEPQSRILKHPLHRAGDRGLAERIH